MPRSEHLLKANLVLSKLGVQFTGQGVDEADEGQSAEGMMVTVYRAKELTEDACSLRERSVDQMAST